MAASSVHDSSAPETLNLDSENIPTLYANACFNDSNLLSLDNGSDVCEKRKRNDPERELTSDPNNPLHPLWKTSLCSYFRREGGSCSHGDSCRFAHGEAELRIKPDKTWDPTSERAKKLMKSNEEKKFDVLMTEALDGESLDFELSKCLVHLPKKWNEDNLKSFLHEQGVVFKSAKKKKGMAVGVVSFDNLEQLKTATEELDGKPVGNNNLKVADAVPRAHEINACGAQDAEQSLTRENARLSTSSNEFENGDTLGDDLAPNGSVSRGRSARDVVAPLAHLPYADQLEHKKNALNQILKKLTRNARKACPKGVPIPDWILRSREIGGLPCRLEGILKSPLVNGYRNKCEFSVGYSVRGKPTVGFMLGNFREGVTAVEEPLDCPNVSVIACKYASVFQKFLQHSSLPIWNRFNNTGFWRQLTVREGRAPGAAAEVENSVVDISEIMLMVQVCSVGFDDEQITREFEKMVQAFFTGVIENPPLPLKALIVQDHKGISNVAPADAPLRPLTMPSPEGEMPNHASMPSPEGEMPNHAAEARIHDYINNLRFCISPTAFFQVNTLAAEKLYSLAGDWANLSSSTLLFDICCGTGTIGLTLAHRVGMVVGIEMNVSAVSDAHRNADINGIKNCRFICAKAEDVMGSLLKQYLYEPQKQGEFSSAGINEARELGNEFENVVAIVDPPRGGLHPTVIKALRTHSNLRRLVYISCNPESLVANAIELCTPSSYDKMAERGNKGNWGWRNMSSAGVARHRAKSMPASEAFQPVKAMAVDMFPHTPHCEMVMLLER